MFKFFTPVFEYKESYKDIENAWTGHIYFSYDLVRNFKPKKIVELGTYKGTSLYSYCQAVKDASLETEIFAVDTWEGDVHMGDFDSSVYDHVVNTTRKHYGKQNIRLVKKKFNEAVDDFDDKSIDLLHIDGTHTYEAVMDDYTQWIPKLSENGVIMFHDTQVADFGVWKVWEEVKKKQKDAFFLEFQHSFGLGVCIKNKSLAEELKDIRLDLLYNYYSVLSSKDENIVLKKEREGMTNTINKQEEKINKLNQEVLQLSRVSSSRFVRLFMKLRSIFRKQ